MHKNLSIKFMLICSFFNSISAMKREDGVAERNARFNEAIKGTQYEKINDEKETYKRTHFEPQPYADIENELDPFQIKEIRSNAPINLQKKLDLIEKGKASRFGNKIFLLHGPPGSSKSSLAKLIAYIAKKDFIFLKGLDITDGVKNSARDYLNDIFRPLIKEKKSAVVIFDEFSALTSKYNNINDGDAGAIQHFWTTSDACRSNPNILIIATLNEIKNLPGPLRSRCKEYFIDAPNFDSRLRILTNYLGSKLISEKSLKNIASKTNGYSIRDLETIIEESEDNFSGRDDAENDANQKKIFTEKDVQDGFEKAHAEYSRKKNEERYEELKKKFKEYAPIIIIPLFRMACDYIIQHAYHSQQVAWNEQCYRENQNIQEIHHLQNLKQQSELANKHHEESKQINEKHHVENTQISERHHKDNLQLQNKSYSVQNNRQIYTILGHLIAPVASVTVGWYTLDPAQAAAAYTLTQAAFSGLSLVGPDLTNNHSQEK